MPALRNTHNVHRSTTLRLLQTLEHFGYVTRGQARGDLMIANVLQQAHGMPDWHARDDREQRECAIHQGHRSYLNVLEQAPVELLVDRLIDRALIWKEEATG